MRDRAKSDPRLLGDLVEIGKVAGQVGIKSFETIMAATEDERDKTHGRLAVAKSRLLRVLVEEAQTRTHLPKPMRPQFPDTRIGKAFMELLTLRNLESRLTPPQAVLNFFSQLKFDADLVEPP